jgi:N-sulfoglucosamine sulfohydrolase
MKRVTGVLVLAWACGCAGPGPQPAASEPGGDTTAGAPGSTAAARRPNIVWIVAENANLEFGVYGEPLVATPNVDRLAAEGVRYTRVFSTAPVCAPSRSAFMTGFYQTTTDTHHMRSHRSDDFRLPEGARPLTHRLKDAGYVTANITRIEEEVVGTGKLDLNYVNEGPIYETDEWAGLQHQQPFFAQFNMPEAEYDIYDRQTWKKERVEWVGEHDPRLPTVATPDNVRPPPYYPAHPVVREEWARYLNTTSLMDVHVGRILHQLEAEGTLEDTVVLFFADNGRMEPRGIHWVYDSGVHVPLIIRWPRNFPAPPQVRAGSVNEDVVSLLDVTATTMAIAGLARPAGMHSRNLLGDDADPPRTYAFSARDRIDETQARVRSVRDRRWRYIRNYPPYATVASLNRYKEKCFLIMPLLRRLHADGQLTGPALRLMAARAPDEELYDTESDPHEMVNLATSGQPDAREALLRLRASLDTWIIETADRGHIPEPPEVVAPFTQEMHDWFGTPDWYEP